MSNYCKYYRQQKYMSIDGGITWTPLQEYQKGRLIERNSDECGYVDPIYRTITSEPYCSGETGYDKYVNELSQVSYDNGRTWQTTATTPTLVEKDSEYCGYVPPTPQYRDVSGTPYCTGYDKYVDVYSQVSYDNGRTWSTTATTSTLVEKNSEDCGYVPPIYEWRVITPTSDPNTYICNDCPEYRTTSGTPYCTGYDKYVDVYSQVSYDSGSTWETTATTPTLVAKDSTDCGYTPSGYSTQYLTFRPNGDTEYWFSYGDSENYTSISYSLNSGHSWTVVDHNQHTVTVHSGDTIMWRGYAANLGSGIGQFHSSGSTWEVEGNVMSLLYFDNFIGQTSLASYGDYVFNTLFYQCTGLTSAENMVLPATTLADDCYDSMFYKCTSLTTAPTLPATTLAQSCYSSMFRNCTSLTTAPTLSATTLANYCYSSMFYGCSQLSSITCLATDISASSCTYNWVNGVASSGTFTTPSSTQWESGSSGIPQNWTRINA